MEELRCMIYNGCCDWCDVRSELIDPREGHRRKRRENTAFYSLLFLGALCYCCLQIAGVAQAYSHTERIEMKAEVTFESDHGFKLNDRRPQQRIIS
jgi:hypothetical protein